MNENAKIKKVIYSEPATIVMWTDGTKTISKCDEHDEYDELTGFLLCVMKKKIPHKVWRKVLKKYVYGNDPEYVKRDVVKDNKSTSYTISFTNFPKYEFRGDEIPYGYFTTINNVLERLCTK